MAKTKSNSVAEAIAIVVGQLGPMQLQQAALQIEEMRAGRVKNKTSGMITVPVDVQISTHVRACADALKQKFEYSH